MTTVNLHYTMNYSQPEEYRFSHDSVFLARFVFEWIQKNPSVSYLTMADFCSGCGVIGLDFMIHLDQHKLKLPASVDFIEIQDKYKDHFDVNQIEFRQIVQDSPELNFRNQNYSEIWGNESLSCKYDLIICNPPYFSLGQGKLSPSEFKNRCRFFIDSDFKTLLKSIQYSLQVHGVGFILLRSLKDHKIEYDLKALSDEFKLELQIVGDVRGTDILRVLKNF